VNGARIVLRPINTPEADLLSAEEMAAWLRIGLTLFRQLVDRGEFPAGFPIDGKKMLRWHWLDGPAWLHLRSRRRR
jgi:predicted DNA-binding transcriptional regulator AlpA